MSHNSGASSGNLVLISKQTASTSANLSFTSIGSYNDYVLTYTNTAPSAGAILTLVFSTNAGVSYLNSNYQSGYNQYAYNTGFSGNASSTTSMYISLGMSAGANETGSGQVYITDITSGAYAKINGQCTVNNGGTCYGSVFTGFQTATGINAMRVLFASGNIVTGTFKLYGVAN